MSYLKAECNSPKLTVLGHYLSSLKAECNPWSLQSLATILVAWGPSDMLTAQAISMYKHWHQKMSQPVALFRMQKKNRKNEKHNNYEKTHKGREHANFQHPKMFNKNGSHTETRNHRENKNLMET